jgi:hypothetical protein
LYQEISDQAWGNDIIVSTVGANSIEDLVKIAENIIRVANEQNIRVV